MRRPVLTKQVVAGLRTIAGHARELALDYTNEGREGADDLWDAVFYIQQLTEWARFHRRS